MNLKNIFKKLMLPDEITSLPTTMLGIDIVNKYENVKVSWEEDEYNVFVCAQKFENNRYNLLLVTGEDAYRNTHILKRDLPIHAAVNAVKQYDDELTKDLIERKITIKRDYKNVRRVKDRLFRNGTLKH